MKFDYLKEIQQLESLYTHLSTDISNNMDAPYVRCIKYGRDLEKLVRYTYSIKLKDTKTESSEIVNLLKNKQFRFLLGKSELYSKAYFIYLASSNASFDHDIDIETADLALDNLKEITYVLFSKINEFTDNEKESFKYSTSTSTITEEKTRDIYIDVNLRNAGYKLNKYKDNQGHGRAVAEQVCVEIEVHNLPNQATGFIDYVIYDKTQLPIAVIEAKKTTKSEEEGAQQARDYADALKKELNLNYRPIIYYTNGYKIKIQDRLGYPAREVINFASIEDLEKLKKRQVPGDIDAKKPIYDKEVDTTIINRSKLVEAVKQMIDSMNVDGQLRRKGLLVLPCGVGKTRTAVALSKILLRNEWVENILFLADRNNLVDNAEKPFLKYIDGETSDISAENSNRNLKARVCICTYNSMLNMINKPKKVFSTGHFDLIFVDEAHRSLFNVYKAIFDYFDSYLIGLTATPSKALDRSTYEILDLDVDKPTFEVKFEEAVNLGYLVSYKAFDKSSKVIENGVKYNDLTDREKEEAEELGIGEGEEIEATRFKRTINSSGDLLNANTIDRMFSDLFTNGLRVEKGNKIGKTLIFARDHKHAEEIVKRFKIKYSSYGDDFCQIIDNRINKHKTRQDNFAKKDSNPQIVVSVDMMDTGVDIPEILNLVFFKNVLSKIKFDQMLGRGTRTCESLYVISPSKDYFEGRTKDDTRIEYKDKQGFFVFDYCKNFDFFDLHPDGIDPTNAINLNQKIYSVCLDILSSLEDIKYQEQLNFKNYYDKLKLTLIEKITSLDKNKIEVKKELQYVDTYSNINSFTTLSEKKKQDIRIHLLRLIDQDSLSGVESKTLEYYLSIIQLSLLNNKIESKPYQNKLMKIANILLTKASIPEIFEKKNLLKMIADEKYYDSLDFFHLELLKKEISPLMKYLSGDEVFVTITNFNDKIETKERNCVYNFDDFRSYREKFIFYLHKHFGELKSVKKILNLEQLDENDLTELQDILNKLKRPEDDYLFNSNEDLIVFIRQIIGLDRKIIDKKCASFINENDFSKEQRQFINMIIDFAIRNGNITNDDLVNVEPFCNQDISAIFENKLDPLFGLVNLFNTSLQITN